MIPIDLFNSDFIPALENQSGIHEENQISISPLLYVGIHKNQLYVQESPNMEESPPSKSSKLSIKGASSGFSRFVSIVFHQSVCLHLLLSPSRDTQFRWKPLSASTSLMAYSHGKPGRFTSTTFIPIENQKQDTKPEKSETNHDDAKSTALIVRHQTEYPFGQ